MDVLVVGINDQKNFDVVKEGSVVLVIDPVGGRVRLDINLGL